MATEVSRNQIAMTDKGQVVVIEKTSFTGDGEHTVSTFEVRHGVRTVGEYDTSAGAMAVASAIAGIVPEPPKVEAKK